MEDLLIRSWKGAADASNENELNVTLHHSNQNGDLRVIHSVMPPAD
jgi:hypothetical protein